MLELLPSTVRATAEFAAPGQRRSQPNIALIQADKTALRSGKQDFGVRAIDRDFDVIHSAVMAKACSVKQQKDLLNLLTYSTEAIESGAQSSFPATDLEYAARISLTSTVTSNWDGVRNKRSEEHCLR